MEQQEPEDKDESQGLGKLAGALAVAQGAFLPIGKDKTGKVTGQTKAGKDYEYTYKYADLADVLASVRKALADNRLALVQRIMRSSNGLYLETRLIHTSGQSIASEYPLTPGGKPQAMGSELTYARRYSVCALLSISPDEDDDGRGAQDAHDRGDYDREPEPPPSTSQRIVAHARACNLTDPEAMSVLKKLGYTSAKAVPDEKLGDVTRALSALEDAKSVPAAPAVA